MRSSDSGACGLHGIWRAVPACMVLAAQLASAAPGQTGEPNLQLRRAGTFPLPARLDLPGGATAERIERVVVLLHGSGPQSMDEDLAAATEDGRSNPFFVHLSSALTGRGFGVLRYHKRSFQAAQRIRADSDFLQDPRFVAFAAAPLENYLEDAAAAVDLAAAHCPRARRYLLGHSQGAYLALQTAHLHEDVAGVGLISFGLSCTSAQLLEQLAYRPLVGFRRLDADHDGRLSPDELAADDDLARSLRGQLDTLDLDGDGELSPTELKAGNLSNWILGPSLVDSLASYHRKEAALPTIPAVLRGLTRPVAFFNGLWDNQTPAYNAKAVEMAHRSAYPGRPWVFRYYPGLGHALDPRDSYEDLVYRRADPSALADVARTLDRLFRPQRPPALPSGR